MAYNESYTYVKCETCRGEGDIGENLCDACDGFGQIGTRRPTVEIAQAHLRIAESAYDSLDGDSANGIAYRRGKAEEHMLLAARYFEIAKLEQLTRIADALYARPLSDGRQNGLANVIENYGMGAY